MSSNALEQQRVLPPYFILRGAGRVLGLPHRAGQRWELVVGGGIILEVRPERPALPSRGGSRGEGEPPVLDCGGLTLCPGLVDLHVHVSGDGRAAASSPTSAAYGTGAGTVDLPGGGRSPEHPQRSRGGRTPEATVGLLAAGGVTTFVGVLGWDTLSRSPKGLLAKVRSLSGGGGGNSFGGGGLTGLMVTGAADGAAPPRSVTGSCRQDLEVVPECLGVGHLALPGCARGEAPPGGPAQPGELSRALGDCLAAAELAGKPGLLYCRLGPGKLEGRGLEGRNGSGYGGGLDRLRDLVVSLPDRAAHILPTRWGPHPRTRLAPFHSRLPHSAHSLYPFSVSLSISREHMHIYSPAFAFLPFATFS